MTGFRARWKPGRLEIHVTVVGFTNGDAVVVREDGTMDRARLRDLRVDDRDRPALVRA